MSNVTIYLGISWTVLSSAVLATFVSFASAMGGAPSLLTGFGRARTSAAALGVTALATTLHMDGFFAPDAFDRKTPSLLARPKRQTPREGARILLADDLDLNRRLIADMLSFQGHEVECVCDGAAAVRIATIMVFDLVLMDMVMPVMDGLEATHAIRALSAPHGNVPIVALTANAFPEHLDACLAAGMDATVTKPMSMDALMRAVDTWRRKDLTAA